ncbi:MAG: sulfurtransferase [Calditrichaeota bacterium]|nr:MAG: sulfurtransferase [Calditrichota bacterium]
MFTPLYKFDFFGVEISFVVAVIIGIMFGFTLERAGFGDAKKLAHQFYFRDMTVLKVMFTAIIVAMIGTLLLNLVGILDMSLIYLNPTYLGPQIAGGVIMGIGFVIGGYCPGTSLVASATGKVDGFIYIAGALFGMLIFGETFPLFQDFTVSGFMGNAKLTDLLGLTPGVVAFLIILMALGMFWGAEILEKKFGAEES